jgi:hypothetical protein
MAVNYERELEEYKDVTGSDLKIPKVLFGNIMCSDEDYDRMEKERKKLSYRAREAMVRWHRTLPLRS